MKDEPSRVCVCLTAPCSCSRIATAPFCYPQNWNESFSKSWPALLAHHSEIFYAYALKPVEPADVAKYRSPRPRRRKNAIPARPVSSPPSSTSSSSSSHEHTSSCNNNNTIDVNKNDTSTMTTRSDAVVGHDIIARTRSKATTVKTKISRKFECELCRKSFDYKHVLMNHQRTHTGEKPYKCVICDKAFTRDHHLKTHTRLHTGEKPFKCPICDKEFVQVANLRRHERVHTGERPYGCDNEGCALKFSDSNQLKAHKMTHTRERPFGCAICDQRYRRKHHLREHKCKVRGGAIKDEPKANSGDCSSGNSSYDYGKDEEERDQFPLDLSVGKELSI